MGERLQRLVMNAFRGVPGEMVVDFGPGQSIAVYGDNGTGKSTIADALEWYFTGQIELLTHEGRQHAIRNLGGGKAPATCVEVVTDGALGGKLTYPDERNQDLNGILLVETPWLLGANPGLRVTLAAGDNGGTYTRLNALGADAYLVQSGFARLQGGADAVFRGNTGLLTMDPTLTIHRELSLATIDKGVMTAP